MPIFLLYIFQFSDKIYQLAHNSLFLAIRVKCSEVNMQQFYNFGWFTLLPFTQFLRKRENQFGLLCLGFKYFLEFSYLVINPSRGQLILYDHGDDTEHPHHQRVVTDLLSLLKQNFSPPEPVWQAAMLDIN